MSGSWREAFYWAAVVSTFALGTARGDVTANTLNLGYPTSAVLYAAVIAVIGLAFALRLIGPTFAFWAAYVMTRPLGASLADWFGKPTDSSDVVTPRGLFYWIVKNSGTPGFNGGIPSGFTDVGGLSPTTYPRWKNWTGQYVNIVMKTVVFIYWQEGQHCSKAPYRSMLTRHILFIQ